MRVGTVHFGTVLLELACLVNVETILAISTIRKVLTLNMLSKDEKSD
jgi:hypothetical protein